MKQSLQVLLMNYIFLQSNSFFTFVQCPSKQYHRIYSPISFGKKYDPNGNYIRHFIPVLKGTHQQHFSTRKQLLCDFRTNPIFCILDMPKEYIYEPWTAPLSIQKKAKCIVGKDYPKPGKKKLYFQV